MSQQKKRKKERKKILCNTMYKSNKTCSGSICQKVQNTTERNQRPERHRVPGLEDSTL